MKAIVYSGHGWNWCDRVKVLLQDNNYEIEEKLVSGPVLEEFQNKFSQMLKSIPQVVIDDKLIGGYAETEAMMKGLKSINKIWIMILHTCCGYLIPQEKQEIL